MESNCRDLHLGVDQAVPLGLIVNEAVTNAMKHAFDGRRGKVTVMVARNGPNCSLIVSDDGRGFEGPPREGSLGMRLMKNLSRQLGARLMIDGSNGTTVTIRWPMLTRTPGEVAWSRSANETDASSA